MHTHDMTNATPADHRWLRLFERVEVGDAMRSGATGVNGLWTPVAKAAGLQEGDDRVLLEALAKVASLHIRPDDWNHPYEPALTFEGRRSPMHTDLVAEEIALLVEAAPVIPHAGLRARAFDILSLLATGPDKIRYAKSHIDSLLDFSIDGEKWSTQRDAWDRGLTVSRRYGRATYAGKLKLEQALRKIIRTTKEGFAPLQAANLLAKHGLATDRALIIGKRLELLAASAEDERKRAYLEGARHWIALGGDSNHAAQIALSEVRSFMDQAEALAATGSANAMRSGHLYEQALQRARQIPRTQRALLGITNLPHTISRRIREFGSLSLTTMQVFESDPIDLSSVVQVVRDRIRNKSVEEALRAYAGLSGWLSIDREIKEAETLLEEHPLQALFTNIHYSADGRVIYRSGGQGGSPIYGVEPAVWDNVVRKYQWHISLTVQGALWPGWVQLTNEHHLSVGDFGIIVGQSGIVPANRTGQFARALYYGFIGDFSTAMQLLAPQMEALVRYHLTNAGESTSTIDPTDHVETEVGLSALMQREAANHIFTRDLAFEIRALFCGPTGPNIRNDVAHGLVSDESALGITSIYTWWFALRLTFVMFWNSRHSGTPDADEAPPSP